MFSVADFRYIEANGKVLSGALVLYFSATEIQNSDSGNKHQNCQNERQ